MLSSWFDNIRIYVLFQVKPAVVGNTIKLMNDTTKYTIK